MLIVKSKKLFSSVEYVNDNYRANRKIYGFSVQVFYVNETLLLIIYRQKIFWECVLLKCSIIAYSMINVLP